MGSDRLPGVAPSIPSLSARARPGRSGEPPQPDARVQGLEGTPGPEPIRYPVAFLAFLLAERG